LLANVGGKYPEVRKVVQLDQRPVILRASKAQGTERHFPHIIEMAIPGNGLDVQLNREIASFHRSRDIRPRFGRTRTQNGQDYCRWCFSDSAIADAFRERFGGARLKNNS
jgi:hypothetical protein